MSVPRILRVLPLLMVMGTFQATNADVRRDLQYGQVGDIGLKMDAYVPPTEGLHPAAIIVHGGGWVTGDRQWSVSPLFQPLEQAGFAWFSISYRFANDVLQFGAAVEDVQQAIHYVREHASEYRIDPARIVLIGESAGAHLGTLAAMREPDALAGVVALYCPSDLETLAQNARFIPDAVRQMLSSGGLAKLFLNRLRDLSPINHVRQGLPPFLLIHGTADSVVPFDQSLRFRAKLREAGVPCDLVEVTGGGHGMRWWQQSGQTTAYRKQMIDWLKNAAAVGIHSGN